MGNKLMSPGSDGRESTDLTVLFREQVVTCLLAHKLMPYESRLSCRKRDDCLASGVSFMESSVLTVLSRAQVVTYLLAHKLMSPGKFTLLS